MMILKHKSQITIRFFFLKIMLFNSLRPFLKPPSAVIILKNGCGVRSQHEGSELNILKIPLLLRGQTCAASWRNSKCQRQIRPELIPPSPGLGCWFWARLMAVFLSVAWRFAGGLGDRFSRLEHPSVFIHGLYGSFHKTFTPWFAMSLCVNN